MRPRVDDPTNKAARAEKLLDAIKLETHWLLISARPRNYQIDESHYAEDRALFVKVWPLIRGQRVPESFLTDFYSVRDQHASALTHLIEIRRQRAHARRMNQ
ncbi:hypothetical protein [Rhodopseudomonas sp. BR0G17]|uniref:hypothetical protein n=1 Tax=Rhodopseudomonas sp. BR0G17 TaxID=2269368 RepID=UPI0013DF9F30|nr:hypothetical protein [Rhodopseudomonas sp. BR0G17]NEW96612.1 hypothetical protein [Rhodopseudomonas sp. BR0G17]